MTVKTVYSKGSEPHDYCKASLTVTGNGLRAALGLAGVNAFQLAGPSRVSPVTIIRMQSWGNRPVRAEARTIDRVTRALEAKGVEITEDGVRLMQKPRP